MTRQKGFITKFGELIDQHTAEHNSNPSSLIPSWYTKILPTPGNIIFTLLLIGGLLWGQSIGALQLIAAHHVQSASSGTIAYQGRLADASGDPLTDTVNMTFRLYAVASGGAPLWEEQWTGANSVQVSDGLFNVMLGSVNAIGHAVITGNSNLFLGITVGTDSEMSPRVQLGSVPFATQALTVPDGSITTEKLADGSVTSAKLETDLAAQNVVFSQQSVQLGHFTTSSAALVDIPGSELSISVDKSSLLQISFTGSLFTMLQPNFAAGALLTIAVDGVDRTDLVNQDLFGWSGNCCAPNPEIAPAGFTVLVPVEAGSHSVKLRIMASSYDGSYRYAGIGYNNRSSVFSVVVLGS